MEENGVERSPSAIPCNCPPKNSSYCFYFVYVPRDSCASVIMAFYPIAPDPPSLTSSARRHSSRQRPVRNQRRLTRDTGLYWLQANVAWCDARPESTNGRNAPKTRSLLPFMTNHNSVKWLPTRRSSYKTA